MSWRRLEDALKPSRKRIEDVLKTSWRRMTKTNILVLIKTSCENVWVRWIYSSWSRRLEDVLWRRRRKTSSRPLQKVFTKTNIFWEVMSLNQWFKDTNLSNRSVLRVYCHFLLGNIYISQALQLWKPFKVIFSCEI